MVHHERRQASTEGCIRVGQHIRVRTTSRISQPHTIYNAHDGGIDHVDAYFFPCPKCSSSAKEQVDEMLDELAKFNLHHSDAGGKGTFGTIWLDIEGEYYHM